jgi:hypothetical protein
MSMKIFAASALALSLLGGVASAQAVDTKTQAGAGLFDQGGLFDQNSAIDRDTTASITTSTQAPVKNLAVPADNPHNERGQGVDRSR